MGRGKWQPGHREGGNVEVNCKTPPIPPTIDAKKRAAHWPCQ